MSKHYIFHESGSIPGVPGTFAGVRVDVGDDGALDIQPLPQHPHFEAGEEEAAEEQSVADIPPEHQPEAVREEQVETAPEQPTSLPEASPAAPVEGGSAQV